MRVVPLLLVVALLALSVPAAAQDPLKKIVHDPFVDQHTPAQMENVPGGPLGLLSATAGIAINCEAPKTPFRAEVTFDGLTVEEALNRIVAADPRLEWRMMSGMVVMRPREAWNDPNNDLNKHLTSFAVSQMPLTEAFSQLYQAMGAPLVRGPDHPKAPLVSVTLTGGSVLDALNAMVESQEWRWIVRYETGNRYPLMGAESIRNKGGFGVRIPPTIAK
jgi:hypothetical protein